MGGYTTTSRPRMAERFHTEANETTGERLTLAVTLPSGREVTFNLVGPRKRYGGELRPPTVNWPSIGARDTADAAAFGAALVWASTVAADLAGPTGPARQAFEAGR